jgi:hypothetical protein
MTEKKYGYECASKKCTLPLHPCIWYDRINFPTACIELKCKALKEHQKLPEIKTQPELRCCHNCLNYYPDYDDYHFCAIKGYERENLIETSPTNICEGFEQK